MNTFFSEFIENSILRYKGRTIEQMNNGSLPDAIHVDGLIDGAKHTEVSGNIACFSLKL